MITLLHQQANEQKGRNVHIPHRYYNAQIAFMYAAAQCTGCVYGISFAFPMKYCKLTPIEPEQGCCLTHIHMWRHCMYSLPGNGDKDYWLVEAVELRFTIWKLTSFSFTVCYDLLSHQDSLDFRTRGWNEQILSIDESITYYCCYYSFLKVKWKVFHVFFSSYSQCDGCNSCLHKCPMCSGMMSVCVQWKKKKKRIPGIILEARKLPWKRRS